MPNITLNGLTYYYEETGRGPAALLLHGFTGSSAEWLAFSPGITGRRLIAVDLPGHGRTGTPADPARGGMGRVTADLVALLDALDIDEVDLLGYSMGGRLALYAALAYPDRVRTLVLESASPGLKTEFERAARRDSDEALAARIEREGIPSFVDFWEGLPLWASQIRLPAAVAEGLRARRLANRPAGLAHSLRGMGSGVQPSLWERLPALERPVLLLVGAEDLKFRGINEEMAAQLPRADLQIVPAAGHTVHLEQPEAFARLVEGFWREAA